MLDVLIVGAGPVGSLLAGILATNGVNVGIVDHCKDDPQPRAMTVNARTAQILDTFDLRSSILRQAPIMNARFAGADVSLGMVDTPWPGQWPCEQSRLTAALRHWAVGEGARALWETRVTGITRYSDPYALVDTDSSETSLSARLVVAADGTDSSVRRTLAVPVIETAGQRTFITANVEADELPPHRFNQTPSGIVLSTGEIQGGLYRVMMYLPPDIATYAVRPQDVPDIWHLATGTSFTGTIVSTTFQTDGYRSAPMAPYPRVVLLGDAAHTQLPVGGCSLNYGLEDAFALAWRIPEVLETSDTSGFRQFALERDHAWQRMQGILQSEIDERYPTSDPRGRIIKPDVDAADFLSGVDIDYSPSNTGAGGLFGWPANLPSDARALVQNAQRTLRHTSIGSVRPDDNSSGDAVLAAEADRRLEDLRPPDTDNSALIRPDGIIVTVAHASRED
ncbi:FAD-dependent oxidoreductase [Leucobacter sp. M11]|uniref:FAD-dependent oxidoreductase n=1 Tax=Leucobacter sp. M11 TaxID=2993565 RepID=UPI002D80516E|nr:FAD-dependent monooxygenase [Leucobacter sp. M11]MEB4613748.1 FAD-dependent monooxygenase [Leucobacter sp. M11]